MAPHTTTAALAIGDWQIDTSEDARTELLALETRSALDGGETRARVLLSVPPQREAGLLEQAVGEVAGAAAGAVGGALGIGGGDSSPTLGTVRGKDVRADATLTVTLGVGERSGKVLAARVDAIVTSLGTITITARGPMDRMAALRVAETFENRSAAQVVRDLADRAGVEVGSLADGDSYPYVVIDPARTVREHVLRLARREGADLGTDEDGRLTMTRFTKSKADHVVRYGVHLLAATLAHGAPAGAKVVVSGEGAASGGGSDRWHWLLRDGADARAEAGSGEATLAIADGASRSRAAADRLAKRVAGALDEARAVGRVALPGAPEIRAGDAIGIEDAPTPGLDGVLKVLAVRHRYDKRTGFVTILDVTRAAAGGDSGGLLGAAAGAIGGLGL